MTKEVIVCQRCGAENPKEAYSCSKCHGSLAGASPAPEPQRIVIEQKSNGVGLAIAVVGLLGIGGAVWFVVSTMGQVRELDRDLSAVQVTQLYTQASFWVLVAIAVLLVGMLWVLSSRGRQGG